MAFRQPVFADRDAGTLTTAPHDGSAGEVRAPELGLRRRPRSPGEGRTARTARDPRRFAGAVAITALAGTVGVLVVTSGSTLRLESASPGDRARLARPPSEVALSFTAPLDPARSHVAVVDARGARVAGGPARTDGGRIAETVHVERDGRYQIVYHVVAGNGRELTGVVPFSVGRPAGLADPAAGRPGAGPADPAPSGQSLGAHDHTRIDPVTAALIGVDIAGVVIAGLLLAIRRRVRASRTD